MITKIHDVDIYYELEGSNSDTLVVLLHGLTMSMDLYPMPNLAKDYLSLGYDVLRFDFIAHGKSSGKSLDMTIEEEIYEARIMIQKFIKNYKKFILVGHSQGGLIASFLAHEFQPDKLILLAPAFNLKEMIESGFFFGKKIKPNQPVHIWDMKISENYLKNALNEEYYKLNYPKILWIHGEKDILVPLQTALKYESSPFVDLQVIRDSNHEFTNCYETLWILMKD